MRDSTPTIMFTRSTLTDPEIEEWGEFLHDYLQLDDNSDMGAISHTFHATYLTGDGPEVNLIDTEGNLHHQTALQYRGVYRRWRFTHAIAHLLLHYGKASGAGIYPPCTMDLCRQADVLVNAILCPATRFKAMWNGDPTAAARTFGISNTAARHRAQTLDLRIGRGFDA